MVFWNDDKVGRPTIAFSAGIDDALWVVGESGEVDAVLLALELLGMFALLTIVDLQCLVILRDEAELTCVVEVEGSDRVRFLVRAWSKPLRWVSEIRTLSWAGEASRLTRVGAKFAITSETFAVGGGA